MTIKVTVRDLHDHLNDINSIQTSEDRVIALRDLVKNDIYASFYMKLATNDVWPSFDRSDVAFVPNKYHYSMAGSRLLNKQTVAMIEQVLLNEKVSKHTKLYQLKSLLEMLTNAESAILLAVLFKDISSAYPNLTHDELVAGLNETNE